jgi:shikimate dehydrogenase
LTRPAATRRTVYLYGGHTEHSLAPTLWNFTFGRLGMAAEYVPMNVAAGDLADEVKRLQQDDVIGANVTIPLKETAAGLATRPDHDVLATGATNWLSSDAGVLHAANTDAVAARELTAGTWQQALLLGAGGGAAAVAAGLRGHTSRIVVADVDAARARRLRDRIRSWGVAAEAVDWEDRRRPVGSSDVLVNATPLGMAGELADDSPVEASWLSEQRVYDLVYAPTETPLARIVRERGLPMIDGLAHLYTQAVALLPYMGIDGSAADILAEGISEAFNGRSFVHWPAS